MPASVSAGDLLLVALKMPPSRTGTYSNFDADALFDRRDRLMAEEGVGAAEIEHELRGGELTAVSLKYDVSYMIRYHSNQPSGSHLRDQPARPRFAAERPFRQALSVWSRTSSGQPAINFSKRGGIVREQSADRVFVMRLDCRPSPT